MSSSWVKRMDETMRRLNIVHNIEIFEKFIQPMQSGLKKINIIYLGFRV